jgi:hypothetical protein
VSAAVRPHFEGGPLFDWAKPANFDRDQQNDNSKYDKNDDGRDVRTTRPQEPFRSWRQSIFIRRVFIIFRRELLSAVTVSRTVHLFAFSPRSSGTRTKLDQARGALDVRSISSR